MGVYVQLLKKKQIDINGHPTVFQVGDWVEVGVGYARRLVADKEATIPGDKFKAIMPSRSGIICQVGGKMQAQQAASVYGNAFNVQEGDWESCPFQRTLFWDTRVPLKLEFVPVGMNLLSRWHVAAPLMSYDKLARDFGDPLDRRVTEGIIHEMRVLVYDPRIVFVRRGPEAHDLLKAWKEEKAAAPNEELAFLRALYRCKPLLLALPPTWRG